jgi:putative transposase
MSTRNRIPWFVQENCARDAIAHLLRTSADYGFDVIAYCFMPDHVHALAEATRADADFRRFVSMFKQRSGYGHLRAHAGSLWQENYFERTMQSDEDCLAVAAYTLANPIRAGLCDRLGNYPYLGSSRYSVDQLREAVQMRPDWKPRRP